MSAHLILLNSGCNPLLGSQWRGLSDPLSCLLGLSESSNKASLKHFFHVAFRISHWVFLSCFSYSPIQSFFLFLLLPLTSKCWRTQGSVILHQQAFTQKFHSVWCMLSRFSHVRLFVTPWTVARQAPLHEISQARILEWVVISSSREYSRPRDQTPISSISCIGRRVLYS